eukprot:m.111621 g.111621  ORF g.111621 m.111621 type:complete len:1086 (-) comp9241_c0_seq1:71-3328(-)
MLRQKSRKKKGSNGQQRPPQRSSSASNREEIDLAYDDTELANNVYETNDNENVNVTETQFSFNGGLEMDIDALLFEAQNNNDLDLIAILAAEKRASEEFHAINIGDFIPNQEEVANNLAEATKDEHVAISFIDLQELQEHEKELQHEIEEYNEHREKVAQANHDELLGRIVTAKEELLKQIQKKKLELKEAEAKHRERHRQDTNKMRQAFQAAESRLLKVLKKRKAEVKATYGHLVLRDGVFSGTRTRKWRLEWEHTPQSVKISIVSLRGLRDKVPSGKFVISVTMYDRLGGGLMQWSSTKGSMWCGATTPFGHSGNFTKIITDVNQSVFTVCPSTSILSPSMIFVFELFMLKKDNTLFDKCLGWGVFPMANSDIEVVDGKFKLPMMRGEVDPSITTHHAIRKSIGNDLDAWLCNLYFDVTHLSRYVSNHHEYEVSLFTTGTLLGHPHRVVSEKKILKEDHFKRALENIGLGDEDALNTTHSIRRRTKPTRSRSRNMNKGIIGDEENVVPGEKWKDSDEDGVRCVVRKAGIHEHYQRDTLQLAGKNAGNFGSNSKDWANRKGSKRVRRIPTNTMQSETETSRDKEYSYSVSPLLHTGKLDTQKLENKSAFVLKELASELQPTRTNLRSSMYWLMVACLLLSFWARLYLHYGGQWVFLQAIRVPISVFKVDSYTCTLNYQPSLTLAREQLGVVVFGPLSVLIVFTIFICIAVFCNTVLGHFPQLGYRFVLAFGALTLLDPFLILLVDVCLLRWRYDQGATMIGDAFKLYWHFELSDDGGLPGVFITIFIYFLMMFAAGVLMYVYILRVHMGGAVRDVYQRLTTPYDENTLPYDNELSLNELEFIVKRAERWRGYNGERRKVVVYSYTWTEDVEDGSLNKKTSVRESVVVPLDESSNSDRLLTMSQRIKEKKAKGIIEETTHISIHTLHLSGVTEIFRQFLILPDGAVVEVYGDGNLHVDKRVNKLLEKSNLDMHTLTRETTHIVKEKFASTEKLIATDRDVLVARKSSVFGFLTVADEIASNERIRHRMEMDRFDEEEEDVYEGINGMENDKTLDSSSLINPNISILEVVEEGKSGKVPHIDESSV